MDCPRCGGQGMERNWNMSPEAACDLIDCTGCRGTGEVEAKPANDDGRTTLTDAVAAALGATMPPAFRWQIEGWAAHLRGSRHAKHTANAWAKHEQEFIALHREAEAVTLARLLDHGMGAVDAVALLQERRAARTAKGTVAA